MTKFENQDKFDAEELEILEAYNSGKIQGSPVPQAMVAAAKQTMKKNKKQEKRRQLLLEGQELTIKDAVNQ